MPSSAGTSSEPLRSRSGLSQVAGSGQMELFDEDSLSRECAKLDSAEQQAFADMVLSTDHTGWPAY